MQDDAYAQLVRASFELPVVSHVAAERNSVGPTPIAIGILNNTLCFESNTSACNKRIFK